MNDDDLSDRLRRLVDRAQPVELDEVTHRHVTPARRPWIVALAGLAVIALVGGAVALLRVDRDEDAPAVTTSPTTVPAPTTTLPAPTTTVPSTTVPVADDGPTEFVGVTTDGRLVVVDVATGQEVRELARLGDPRTPATPEDPIPPNHIESVEVIRATDSADVPVDQVLFGTCCEPAVGEVFAIGIDGGPTTIPPFDGSGEGGRLFFGHHPAADDHGTVLVASLGDGAVSSLSIVGDDTGGAAQYDLDAAGSATDPAWIRGGEWEIAYEVFGSEGSTIHLAAGPVGGDIRELTPPDGMTWTDPVGIAGQLVVAEQCCADEQLDDPATGRVIDTASGEVVDSFLYSGAVADQDVSATGDLIVTYRDGRVVALDPDTGDEQALASGFLAASW